MIPATRSDLQRLQSAMSEYPQVECETKHYFANGMYCREVTQPKDVLVVGKVHKVEHFLMLLSGTMVLTDESGPRQISAPHVLVSKPGTKRGMIAVTEAVYVTVHRTELTDIDEIEAAVVEPDPTALFDAHNRLKNPELEARTWRSLPDR